MLRRLLEELGRLFQHVLARGLLLVGPHDVVRGRGGVAGRSAAWSWTKAIGRVLRSLYAGCGVPCLCHPRAGAAAVGLGALIVTADGAMFSLMEPITLSSAMTSGGFGAS